ncbi:uncharacterized protein [Drosophila kikkawai]|uniref:Uncharacterized protein n=1 Tax=Drosophila kikkawai TaxID=30033 RepID=A0A6P4JI00_DROKI|nr:uncharacterized protein LOC108083805 [Drosophila kikkawai]
MATDIYQNRLNHMRPMDYGQEQGLQQILQPSAVQGDDQAQQVVVPRKTIYTRAELLCRDPTTTQNNTLQPAEPQTPLSPNQGYAMSMPKMPPRKRTYMDLLAQLPQTGKKMPNCNLTRRMGTVIDLKEQIKMSPSCLLQRQEQIEPDNKEPSRNLTRMQMEMDLKKEEPCEIKKTPNDTNFCIPNPKPILPKGSRIPVLSRSRYRDDNLDQTKQNPIRMRTEITDLRIIRHKDSKIPVLDKSWIRKCILKEREEQSVRDKNRFKVGITDTQPLKQNLKQQQNHGGAAQKKDLRKEMPWPSFVLPEQRTRMTTVTEHGDLQEEGLVKLEKATYHMDKGKSD